MAANETTWQPGQSGNPKGSAMRGADELASKLNKMLRKRDKKTNRPHLDLLLEELIEIARDPKAKDFSREEWLRKKWAIEMIFNRRYGKEATTIIPAEIQEAKEIAQNILKEQEEKQKAEAEVKKTGTDNNAIFSLPEISIVESPPDDE